MARPMPAVDPLTKAVFPTSCKSTATSPQPERGYFYDSRIRWEDVKSEAGCRSTGQDYMFIFLKRDPGMARTSSMIQTQNQGR
jgi:hypothetical protein